MDKEKEEMLAESMFLCASMECPFRGGFCQYPALRAELGKSKEDCVKMGACYMQITRADYSKYYRKPKS